jgi:adenosylcobinamide-phosphate synthase
MLTYPLAMLIALIIDAAIGWPDALYRRIGHPVTWIGALIAQLEGRFNTPARARKIWGVAVCSIVTAAAALPALVLVWALVWALPSGLLGALIMGVLCWPLVAARAMYTHVEAVRRPLMAGDMAGARHHVSMIVGRDPAQLDEAGIARAALESLAENTSDGITAPLFWGAVLGPVGIAAYKAINTLDSMIGHKSPRYLEFGWFSARLDDWVNLIPARATGAIFAAMSGSPIRSARAMLSDARAHRSPNAGWPEAAMAGALNIRLSGPRSYGDTVTQEPWLNAAAPDPTPASIAAGLSIYLRSIAALALCLLLISAFGLLI